MKAYLIWLKSGSCLEGEMTEEEAKRLINEYKNINYTPFPSGYKDKEGMVYIKFHDVEAIAINDIKEDNCKMGFKEGE